MAACKDCRFYEKERCRRFPPAVVPNFDLEKNDYGNFKESTSYNTYEQTWVAADDWCGEFQPEESPK